MFNAFWLQSMLVPKWVRIFTQFEVQTFLAVLDQVDVCKSLLPGGLDFSTGHTHTRNFLFFKSAFNLHVHQLEISIRTKTIGNNGVVENKLC